MNERGMEEMVIDQMEQEAEEMAAAAEVKEPEAEQKKRGRKPGTKVQNQKEQKPKRKYTRDPSKALAKQADAENGDAPVKKKTSIESVLKEKNKMEEGYQQTVKLQLEQIKELVKMTQDMQSDMFKLIGERDRLVQENNRLKDVNEEMGRGLLAVRAGLDVLHRMMHEGETE